MSLRYYLEALLGLLYPQERSCISCRGLLPETASDGRGIPGKKSSAGHREEPKWFEEKGLCTHCTLQLVPIQPPYCLLCGRHIPESGRCPECERNVPFVLSRSFGKYEGMLRDLLHRYKFSREAELLPVLAFCLCQAWDLHLADCPFDWIVPVPVHPQRLKERGYNQAEQLALRLSSYSSIPCLPVLQRTLHLKGQATRDRKERLKALQNTYLCDLRYRNHVSDKRILLVDDIYTTGSTAEACAAVLLNAGAAQVYVITVAR